jgi:type I restriction enzyme S subunit
MTTNSVAHVRFHDILRPNRRPYELGADEDADLVGMRLYGLGPFFRERKLASQIQKKSHFVIRENDVIYNKLFAWKGTFGIVPLEFDGMYVSDKFPTYALDTARVDRDYLRWYFRYAPLWEQARQMSTGSAALSKLTLNPPKFLELTIPLFGLAEQRRIASKIDGLAAKLEEVATISTASLDRYEAYFLSALDRQFDRLSKAAELRPLASLVDSKRGISYGVVQTGLPFDDGVPTLRAGDLQRFVVRTEGVKRIAPEIAARFRRTRLEGNEVLLRIRGGLGEVAMCPPELIGGNVSREIAVIPLAGDLLPEYVMFAMARPTSQIFLRQHLRGTSYVGINLHDVRRLQIPTPTQKVQEDTVRRLRSLQEKTEAMKQLQTQASAAIDAMLPSILDRAFKGVL